LLQTRQVALAQAHRVQRHGARRGQQAQHRVFEPVGGRDRDQPQFQALTGHEAREIDLAVLRFAALGYVEVAHDLQPRDHRVAVGVRQLHVGFEYAVLAKAHAQLVAPGLRLDVDVGHGLLLRLDDHRVDQAHQRVVGLLDLALVVAARLGARLLLLQVGQELVGVVGLEIDGLRRVGGHFGRAPHVVAQPLVHAVDGARQHAAACQRGHDLDLRDELHLFDHPRRRGILERDHQPLAAHQQRQHIELACGAQRQALHGLGCHRKSLDVDDRVAHLASQRGLQVFARHRALAHQQLAERHAAVLLLLLERRRQLRIGHETQCQQRLADPHHRHARLLLDRCQQLLGRHHLLRNQDVAELARAHGLLFVECGRHLLLGRRVLLHQHRADALADLEAVDHRLRHEVALHAA
jgi:hypothetical protein